MIKQLTKIVMLVTVILMVSCQSESSDNSYKAENPNLRKVVVKEVIQTPDYSYVKLKEANDVYWAAVARNDNIKKGNTFYFDQWMEMNNFKSEVLDRTFESIFFIDRFSDKPFPSAGKVKTVKTEKTGSSRVSNLQVEQIEPAEGGITLTELFSDPKKYDGKTVTVRGKVVKYTEAVLNKNWLHLQDGTQANGRFDLAVTTDDTAKVGDVVTFRGKIILDKDFGYGYKYDVLLENAELVK